MDSLPSIKPRELKTSLVEEGDTLTATFSPSAAGGCFLTFWLIGWSVGCVFLASEVVLRPRLLMLLLGIPFWAAWVFVAAIVLKTFFGRRRLSLSPDGIVIEDRVLRSASVRRIPLAEIVDIRDTEIASGDDGPQRRIEVVALGENLLVDPRVDGVEHRWLVHRLTGHLEELRRKTGEPAPLAEDREDCRGVSPPSDSRWDEFREDGGLVFEERGRLDLSTVGGLLFVNLFWNGIVSVFLCLLVGKAAGVELGNPQQPDEMPPQMWWGLCLFLLPFEAVGLAMMAALVVALLEPLRVTRWRFTDLGAECSLRYLSVGRTWTYGNGPIERLSIVTENGWWRRSWRPTSESGGTRGKCFDLLVVDRDGAEICRVKDLTCGNALWMKGRLQEELAPPR